MTESGKEQLALLVAFLVGVFFIICGAVAFGAGADFRYCLCHHLKVCPDLCASNYMREFYGCEDCGFGFADDRTNTVWTGHFGDCPPFGATTSSYEFVRNGNTTNFYVSGCFPTCCGGGYTTILDFQYHCRSDNASGSYVIGGAGGVFLVTPWTHWAGFFKCGRDFYTPCNYTNHSDGETAISLVYSESNGVRVGRLQCFRGTDDYFPDYLRSFKTEDVPSDDNWRIAVFADGDKWLRWKVSCEVSNRAWNYAVCY